MFYCSDFVLNPLTPLQPETFFFTNVLEVSTGRDMGALKRVKNCNHVWGDKLLGKLVWDNVAVVIEV